MFASYPERNPSSEAPIRPSVSAESTFRWMETQDEARFRALLNKVYQGSYTYRSLYQEGTYSALLKSGRMFAAGEFDVSGDLVGHTAFLAKDPESDFIEQGIAMKDPSVPHICGQYRTLVFRQIQAQLAKKFHFVHQNITTYHPAAQAFASRYQGAFSCGLIYNYVSNEQISGIDHSGNSMHPLMMTSALFVDTHTKTLFLPEGGWGDWLAQWMEASPLKRKVERSRPVSTTAELRGISIEENRELGLTRHRVVTADRADAVAILQGTAARQLVHLPVEDPVFAQNGFAFLMSRGFVPVGWRPGKARSDEVVFQYLVGTDPSGIAEARLVSKSDRAQFNQWRMLCEKQHPRSI